MKNNEVESSIIPEEHPFRHMLFDYIPKQDTKEWNVEHEKKKKSIKNLLNFYSQNIQKIKKQD